MTSIHFQEGVRKANKKIDKLLRKRPSVVAKRLERLQEAAMKRYWMSLDSTDEAIKDFHKGYYVGMSYYLYRGTKFKENMEF